ncbi:Protein CBG25346 [Caenorhabditis briggsae]|uniref:Protein CBG25346 n=1 Tax=Caenorhabditis briggsae TaxID=6238 RepID=B6IIL0_CAEBR|nr:Protein CBG25346 [Caenorhabditis briggsae]CAR99740.1 Protein CBG25346 [Caenorhabditis briggsae]
MSCFNYTPFYALSTLLSFGLAVIILCYDAYVLFYLKLKYVWPPFLLNDVQVVLPPGSPFTNEEVLVYFAKVFFTSLQSLLLVSTVDFQ